MEKWNWSVEYGEGEHSYIRLHDGEIPFTYDPEVFVEEHNKALVQAREPLVEAINRLFALVDVSHYERAKAVRDAALFRAEEK